MSKLKNGIRVLEWRCCKGKIKYATFEEADDQAKLIKATTHDQHIVAYKCKACSWFHTGHKRR